MSIKIIISPTMKMKRELEGFPHEQLPMFLTETEELLEYLKSRTEDELKTIWQTSEKIAQVNIQRICEMELTKNVTPAILAFQGLQYQYLGAQVLSHAELAYLEEHLYIVSGFYGLLKPLDGVVPYRLEMKATFAEWQHASPVEFWGDRLAKAVQAKSSVLLNLASKEYSDTILPYVDEGTRVIDFVFGEWIDGKVKQKATLLKMARGEMLRYLATNQITNLEEVKAFTGQGYQFDADLSDEERFVFVKEQ